MEIKILGRYRDRAGGARDRVKASKPRGVTRFDRITAISEPNRGYSWRRELQPDDPKSLGWRVTVNISFPTTPAVKAAIVARTSNRPLSRGLRRCELASAGYDAVGETSLAVSVG
jgi:hypothetical protein